MTRTLLIGIGAASMGIGVLGMGIVTLGWVLDGFTTFGFRPDPNTALLAAGFLFYGLFLVAGTLAMGLYSGGDRA